MREDFRDFIKRQRKYYKSIVSVNCPILQGTVFFTSEGFDHLLYKTNREPRKLNERYMKLMCLNNARDVIKKCKVISETREVQRKIKGRRKVIIQHELVHEIKRGVKIRVVVEKIGSGKLKFRSVMPHNNRSKPKKRPKRRF